MRYSYSGHTREGNPVHDYLVAKNKKEALGKLANRGIVVEGIRLSIWKTFLEAVLGNIQSVSLRDKMVFTRSLSLMIKSGITIDESLIILAEQSTNPALRRILTKTEEAVQAGKTLSESMALYPRVFDTLYVNIVYAAETSGSLAESLDHLAEQLRRQYELRSKVLGALFYPAIVIGSTITIGIGLSVWVLPKITSLFRSFDTELPWTTRVVISFATFMQNNPLVGAAILFGIVLIPVILARTKLLKPVWEYTLYRIPTVSKIVKDFNLALFARTMNTLLTSGVPINGALDITGKTLRNGRYKRAIEKMVVEQQTGESLGYLLSQRPNLFPPIAHRMILVGEQSGNLDESLSFLAEFHEEELDYTTKNISTVVEPLLIIVVGIGVAILALAIITPIYQITGSFQPR